MTDTHNRHSLFEQSAQTQKNNVHLNINAIYTIINHHHHLLGFIRQIIRQINKMDFIQK